MPNQHETINYIELPASDFVAIKRFFSAVFSWTFTDYGEEYCAFSTPTMEGGFYQSDLKSSAASGSALIVFYSENLEATAIKILKEGGEIVTPAFDFPGGRRFHFADPHGNEFAVWSDV